MTALRAMDNDVPVCVLSARSSVTTGWQGWRPAPTTTWSSRSCWPNWWLGCGAAAPKAARRRHLLGDHHGRSPGSRHPGRRARVNGVDVDLTKREFDLLAVLAEHNRGVVPCATARAGLGL